MSRVRIKNVSRDKGLMCCDLADGSSLMLQYGQSRTLDETLLTSYIKRMESKGNFIISKLPDVDTVKSEKENKKTSGKKNNAIKEVKEV